MEAKVKMRLFSQRKTEHRIQLLRGAGVPSVGATGTETEFEVVGVNMSGRPSAGFGFHITILFNPEAGFPRYSLLFGLLTLTSVAVRGKDASKCHMEKKAPDKFLGSKSDSFVQDN